MAGKGDAGIVDDALVHRRRDHRRICATDAAVERRIENIQDVTRVGGVEPAGDHRRAQRHVTDVQSRAIDAQLASTILQQGAIADDHEACRHG